ncbi:MAG: hypothetical protein V6017_00185 [Candidatus Dasytiphilus stammeri]
MLYPWLNDIYFKLIQQYQINRGHHALLIYTNYGLRVDVLIWKISCWLMCSASSKELFNCGYCTNCKLMQTFNHPNWYKIDIEPEKKTIGIEIIRHVCDKLYHKANISKAKIIWITQTNKLTEAAINTLLKILEEPPNNTFFFYQLMK